MSTWTRIADLSIKKGGMTLSCVDSNIYAIGGYTGTTDLTMNECYGKSSNTWVQKTDTPSIISHHSSVVIGNEIYTLGSSSGSYNKVSAFNTITNTWRLVTTTPYNVYWGGAVTYNGYIYLIAGLYDGITNDNLYRLDLTTNTWTKLASLPITRDSFACCVTPDGYIYVLGGKNDSLGQTTSDAIYRYSITNDSWELLNIKLPAPMSKTSAVYSNGNIYIVGGENNTTSYLNYFLEYNIEKNIITELTTIPTGTYSHGLCVDESDNTLYLAGGFAGGSYVPTAYSYQLNPPPQITIDNPILGSIASPLIKTYTVSDEGNSFDIIEKINDVTIRTLTDQVNGEFTIDLTSKWDELSHSNHTLTIIAMDKTGASATKTITFRKVLSDLQQTTDLITTVNAIKNIDSQIESISNDLKTELAKKNITVNDNSGMHDMVKLINDIPIGKKYASGLAKSSSTRTTFKYASDGSAELYYLEFKDLGFTPSTIVASIENNSSNIAHTSVLHNMGNGFIQNMSCVMSFNYYTANNDYTIRNIKADDKVFMPDGTIRLPLENYPYKIYNWIAYE